MFRNSAPAAAGPAPLRREARDGRPGLLCRDGTRSAPAHGGIPARRRRRLAWPRYAAGRAVHGTSDRSNFEKLNAYDFEYGGNMTYNLPLGISLSTDLKEYCRRGYSEKSINTSDLVWNASLARSFCKGKLTLKAEAFDILQNLSSTV